NHKHLSIFAQQVVTGAGFPEWRRVRLLLSEDLGQHLRKVRVMHISRPLMGGLSWAPENAGELDMITVDKYTAVLKSYP
ncbi:unnamed protein product, partial [Ectocarpus sp. 8 AP-2014]